MSEITTKLASRLKQLRQEADLSLDQLAQKSSVSRATLSRLEKAEVSPTAEVLGKLCAVYALPMSRLLAMVEEGIEPLVIAAKQPVWRDPENGFVRTSISPPAQSLKGEVIRCELLADQSIEYDQPSLAGLEHHLVLEEGELEIQIESQTFNLKKGDCLRYQLRSASKFTTPKQVGAKYTLFLV